jgi:hypothetical protein
MKDKQRYTQWLDLLILSLPNCQQELNPHLEGQSAIGRPIAVQAFHADPERHNDWTVKIPAACIAKAKAERKLVGTAQDEHLVMDASSLAQSHQGTLINASSTNQNLTPISLTSLWSEAMQDLDTFIHLFFLPVKCVVGPDGIIAIAAVALQAYLNDEYKGEVDRAAFTNILHAAGLSGGA